jgi:hypothetical protein
MENRELRARDFMQYEQQIISIDNQLVKRNCISYVAQPRARLGIGS